MAKKQSGLGRGLNSLLGESPAPSSPAKEKPKPEEKKPVEQKIAVKVPEVKVEEPVKAVTPSQLSKPVTNTAPKKATTAITEGKDYQRDSREEELAEKAVVRERPAKKVEKPKPYIEEEDNVTIKGVVSRERKEVPSDEVDINKVQPNPDQPRTHFKKEEIEELAASIDREGLLQPILVRKVGQEYQIIAGERRWQACKSLNMKKVPVRFKEASDDKALELALIENIQRSNLNPIEEAYGYKRLMERQKMTQSEVAVAVSKGRSTVANALRLLELPEDAQKLLFEEKITAGHARAILSIPTAAGRQKLTEKLIEEKLTVREAEAIARLLSGKVNAGEGATKREPLPTYFKKTAKALRDALGTNVRLKQSKGKNKIEIEFSDEQDLERMFVLLTGEKN